MYCLVVYVEGERSVYDKCETREEAEHSLELFYKLRPNYGMLQWSARVEECSEDERVIRYN